MGLKQFLQEQGLVKKDTPKDPGPTAALAATPMVFPITKTGAVSPAGTDYDAYFDQVWEKNNIPGMDFLEFHKTLKTYDNKPLPEQQKYEFAYTSFEACGVTPANLVETSKHYDHLLDVEADDFAKQEAEETQTKVTAKQQEVERITRENEEFNRRIQDNNATAQKLSEEIYLSTNTIAAEKQAFESKLSNRRALVVDRVAKINQYLNGTTSIPKG